jgi:hypothetical protein
VNRTFIGAARLEKALGGRSVSAEGGGKAALGPDENFQNFTEGKSSKRPINRDFQESGREFNRFQRKKQRKFRGL